MYKDCHFFGWPFITVNQKVAIDAILFEILISWVDIMGTTVPATPLDSKYIKVDSLWVQFAQSWEVVAVGAVGNVHQLWFCFLSFHASFLFKIMDTQYIRNYIF